MTESVVFSTEHSAQTSLDELCHPAEFLRRHIGPDTKDQTQMLAELKLANLEELIDKTVPASIRNETTDTLAAPCTEHQALTELAELAKRNRPFKSYIGLGYHDTLTPNVILRNVLENPGWYTAYTPYQPEIAQGRLEGLLNFQQMVMDLTGMEMANASMLDEATAAAEAMAMSKRLAKQNRSLDYFVAADVHPQTLAVVRTRAEHFGFNLIVDTLDNSAKYEVFGALLQYPGSTGEVKDLAPIVAQFHEQNALVTVAADLLALALLKSPGEMGADIAVGTNQRFGIPMGFGGPHAGFFAFREAYKRAAPGRIIGVSIDNRGKQAMRMAMQTREQHIRREKANSNICTAQVLLAVMSVFYAMYHGPEGIRRIATRVHLLTRMLAEGLVTQNYKLLHENFFDTVTVNVGDNQQALYDRALAAEINLRKLGKSALGISLNETTTAEDVLQLLRLFSGGDNGVDIPALERKAATRLAIPSELARTSAYLTHPIFSLYHSETEMLRYLKRLESKDIALNHAMIPLGSCTMKLNATAEMIPVTWPEFAKLHPFAPIEQAAGYSELFRQLQDMLIACTGYDAISLQPNAGSQGEYAGLIVIKKYFEAKNDFNRTICLIPASAHGTNPASAQMVGLDVVVIKCDAEGNVDTEDLGVKITQYGDTIAALMVTYPSTHGVFEENIREICDLAHSVGAQVYIDGANMNALVGVAAPGTFGGDVSHLNLHKTFCIPHGGGGPGMGPIGVKDHLAAFLPGHPLQPVPHAEASNGTISAAPWGSASILPISWMYIRMMGNLGVKRATEIAILNANYVAHRLQEYYPILYKGRNGFIAHECLLDLRPLKESSGITEEDIAKRLMDYGFHAPTMSFPVAGTLMIEPTESESKAELDRFCDAMIQIRKEIATVEAGEWPTDDNPLHNAPHTLEDIMSDYWDKPYSRDIAARPLPYLQLHKVWPSVNRIDNVYGDRNLVCSCPSMEAYF